jgi:hypothetical protein
MREFELALNNRFMSSERWRRLRVEGRQLVEIGRNQGTAPTLEQTWFNKGKPLLVKDV